MDEKELKLLWESLSKSVDIGEFDNFKSAMSDVNRRKKFYDLFTSEPDGKKSIESINPKFVDYSGFDTYIGGLKKKEKVVSGQPSETPVVTSPSPSQSKLPSVDPTKTPEENVYDLGETVANQADDIYSQSRAKIQDLTKQYNDYVKELNQQLKDGVIDNFTAQGLLGHKKKRIDKELESVNASYQQSIKQLNNLSKEERKKILNPRNRKTTVGAGEPSSEGQNALLLDEIYELSDELNSLEDGDKNKERISQELKQKKQALSGRLGISGDGVEAAISNEVYSDTIGNAPSPQEIREYEIGIKQFPVTTAITQQRRKSGQLFYQNAYNYYQDNPRAASKAFSETFMDLPDATGARKPSQYDFEMVHFMIKNGKEAIRDENGILYVPDGAKDVDVNSLKEQYTKYLKALAQKTSENFVTLTPSGGDIAKLKSGAMTKAAFNKKFGYENIINNLKKQLDLSNQFVSNEKDRKEISEYVKNAGNFIVDVTGSYGAKEYRDNKPEYDGLSDYEKIYLEYLRAFDPEKYESRLELLKTPSSLIQGASAEWNPEFQRGYQFIKKEAEDVSISLLSTSYLQRIEYLSDMDSKGRLTEKGKAELGQLIASYEDLQKFKNSQIDRYPFQVKQEIIDNIGKATDDNELSGLGRFVYGIGHGIGKGVDWLYESIASNFTNEDSRISDFETVGDEKNFRSKMNMGWEDESVMEGSYKYAIDPEFKKIITEIDNNDKLNDKQKYDAKIAAFNDYRNIKGEDPVVITKNPNAGDINLSVTAILNTTSDVAQQIISQIALAYATGGMGNVSKIRSLATLFGTTFAQSMDRYEAEAIMEGKRNPTATAIRKSTIDALTELYGDDLMQVKNLFKGKGSVGKIVETITDAEWKSVVAARKGIYNKVKNVVGEIPKRIIVPTLTEAGEETVAQVLNNAFDGKPIGEGVKESMVTTLVGTIGTFGLGLPFSFRAINNSQKINLYNAGANSQKYLDAIKGQLQRGEISQEEANKRTLVINQMKDIIEQLPNVDENGNPLSDQQLLNLSFNKYVEEQAKKAKQANPKSTKIDQVIDELQDENNKILSGEAVTEVKPEAPQQTLFEQISKRIEEIDAEEKAVAAEVAPEVPEPTVIQQKESISAAVKEAGYDVTPEQLDRIYNEVIEGGGKIEPEKVRRILNSGYSGANMASEYINELGIKPGEVAPEVTEAKGGMAMVRSINELKGEVELMKQGKDTPEKRAKIAEFEKEIAEQERLGIDPDKGRAVSVEVAGEVAPEVPKPTDVEAKKAEIERRRQEELSNIVYRGSTGGRYSTEGKGFYFTSNKGYAELYTQDKFGKQIEGSKIKSYKLSIKNPYKFETEGAFGAEIDKIYDDVKKQGYDAIIASDKNGDVNEIVVFDKSQIQEINEKEINAKYDAELAALKAGEVAEAKPVVPEKTTSDEVANDLLNFLGIKSEEGDVKFSKTTGLPEVVKPVDEKEREVIDQMNSMSLVNEGVDLDAPSTTDEKIDVNELNSRLDNPLEKVNWDDYEGIPFAFTISDQLRSGDVTNPATGEVITDLKGGIGFNGTAGNEGNAWANTSKDEADALLSKALDVYNANKPLFEKLWADGKLPNGHIPVAVVKMAESAILSNEAVFRVGIQNIKTLPERNRQKAVLVLNKTLKQKAAQLSKDIKRGTDIKTGAPYSENTIKAKKKLLSQYNKIQEVINKYAYKDIVSVLEDGKHFSLPEKAIITSEVFYGAPTPIGGKPIDIARSRPSTPVSVALIGNKNPELINIGRITDLLTEPAMKDIPNMHVVSIVGVDVKNPQTTETNHPNYKFGVKGQSIGILESPVHMKDAFGEAYGSAISQVTKNEASNASINAKQAMTQGIPVQAGLPNRVLKGAIARKNLDAIDKLTGFLRQAFPSTTFFTSQEAWDAAMADPSIKKKLKEGEVVYAFTTDGNVYMNPNLKTTKAALHETGHIWMEFVKESNPKLYEKGLSLVEGTKELEKAKQQYGDTRLAREEALMELMSSKGDTIVNASQKAKFKEWLLSLYKYISDSFTSLLGLSPKEIENLTLDKFLEGMLADILSGKEVTSKKIKTQLKLSAESTNDRIGEFIKLQREKGISDEDIRAGIEKVAKSVGLSKSDIDNLMTGEVPTKPKEYAVQEQAAGEVPVQPKAGVGEEVEGGVPPTEPPKPPKEGEVEGEEREVVKPSGIKKALVSQDIIAKMNLEKVGDKELLANGRKIIDSGEVNPPSLVNKILDEGKGVLTPAEVVALITYKADLDNQQLKLIEEIAKREKAGENLGTLLADLKKLQTEIDNFDMAAVITAQQQSMSFRLRRYMLDRAYNVVVQIEKYKLANNGVIPENIEKRFREMDAEIKELNKKLKEAEAAKYDQEGQAAMDNIIEDVQREQANGPKLYTETELEEKIKAGVQSEIDKIYSAMPAPKKSVAQRAIAALENIQRKLRSRTYDASLGIPVAIIDAGIGAIKNAIKLGIEVEKAVEIGIKTIKDKLRGKPWPKENDFRKDMIDGFKAEGVSLKAKKTEPKINDDGTVTIPNQLIRDLVAQGITDIDDLANAVRKIVEPQLPGVTNRQVRDYITKYGKEVNPTRDDLTIKMNTAKRIGRLLSRLEDMQKMGAAVYMIKYRTQKPSGNKLTQKEQELKKLINQLEKDAIGSDEILKKIQEQKDLDDAKARIRRRIDELRGKIARKDFSKKAKKQVPADQELRDLQAEKEKIKEEFDRVQYEAEQKNKSLGRKINDALNELLVGLARTLVTGFDFGVVLTQGVIKFYRDPIMSAKAFAEGMRQFASESRQKKYENELKASGAYALIKNSGLAISVGEERASVQEQIFIANYVSIIWNTIATIVTFNHKRSKEFVKALNPFKASQRFMDAYLNYIRINTFLDISSSISKEGYPPEVDPDLHKSAAEWVNTTTMKGAKNIPRGLGFLMFSASKVAAELKMFSPYVFVYYAQMPAPLRKRAILNFGKFALSFLAVNYLLRAALGDDEDEEFWDSTSSNFLTFKFGDQRISFAGGIRPMLVFWSRLISGRYVDQYGEVSKLGERPGKDVNTKADLIKQFFVSKFAPVPSAAYSKLNERAGREVEDDVLINKLVLPMWLQDSGELYESNPREIGALYTTLSLIGANVRTVEKPSKKEQKVGKSITYTDEYKDVRKIDLTEEQRKDYQKLFDEIYANKIKAMKDGSLYKKKSGEEKITYEAAFVKKAKEDAEKEAKDLLVEKYMEEFMKFPPIIKTPEEEEMDYLLGRDLD